MAKKKSKKKVYITISFLVIIIAAIIIFLVAGKSDAAISVTVTKVEKKTITQTVTAIGKIEAETEVKISSETSGEIVFLAVKEGDTVKANSLLARIKPDIIETQLEQYKAAAEAAKVQIDARKLARERAKSELNRVSELYAKKFASTDEFEAATNNFDQSEKNYQSALYQYEQALATLKQIQRSADRTTIFSPINGIVTKLSVEKGEKVVGTAQYAGTEMMVISDLSVMNSIVEVDENDITMVKIGDTARVEIDAIQDVIYKGTVIEVGHSAIQSSLGTQDQVTNFQVKIRLLDKEARLRPGMSCNVDIETETRENVLAIPLQSVTVRDSKLETAPDVGSQNIKTVEQEDKKKKVERPASVVFVKDGKKVKMATVKTGISDKGFIEITEGLKEGEEVVSGSYMAVSKLLKDGSVIKIDSLSKKKKE
ncbi:MAG TPA: efflux RND transporter periplasmic adaptor subunit [Candidatus Kapabacteria bacterium]|nr:efflux RND transporter periplasmic adaptor subunit [Candidatus Kapabacteria bacterium]HPO63835.1 efflux RND transporter periplasmic adaptor subunit [Candidatus Kapabacteria bacterium]